MPSVYRYLQQAHINEFFETGRLRLSSFRMFAQHLDERKDSEEGRIHIYVQGKDMGLGSFVTMGLNAFVLSTSTLGCDEHLKNKFSASYFRIRDPVKFCWEIASVLESFTSSLQGLCKYQEQRLILRDCQALTMSDWKDRPMAAQKIFRTAVEAAGPDIFFIKLKEFEAECEYRFVWHVSDNDVPDHVFVECPRARDFCEPVT